MNYDMDGYERPAETRTFWLKFFVFFLLFSALFFFAYQSGFLPHYTLLVDGNKWEWVRDDARYLASLSPKQVQYDDIDRANQKIIAQNRANFEHRRTVQDEVDQSLPTNQMVEINGLPQQVQQHQSGQVVKCVIDSGHFFYQNQDCSASGMKPVKALTQADLMVSRSDAQPTEILNINTEQNYKPAVTSINVDKKSSSLFCRQIESDRDNVRSQQRIHSTQWLRDEYDRLSKLWQSNCLG